MTAFNVVRFRVKPGMEEMFVDSHRNLRPEFRGFLGGNLIKTGDRTFCLIGEWQTFPSIVAARPQMIELLDSLRHMLEDLGGELGVTDPVSGHAVAKLAAPKPRKNAAKKAATKAAKKGAKRGAKKGARKAAKKTTRRPAGKAAKRKAAPARRKARR
jgi:hypothetical protein